MIETEYVVKHLLGVHGRTVGIEGDGLQVIVDGHLPVALLPVFITQFVIFLCSHWFGVSD